MKKFRKDINFLRSVSVISVLLYHTDLNIFNSGYLGVDVFFVISGFLIGSNILDNLATGTFSFKEFYVKRIRRLFPVLIFTIGICMAFVFALYSPDDARDFEHSALYSILFGSNIYFWQNIDYFSPNIDLRPLAHTWSLGIEEQFYFILPIGMYLLYFLKISEKLIFKFILIISSLSFYLTVNQSILENITKFYLLPTRLWELLLGVLGALLVRNYQIRNNSLFSNMGFFLVIMSLILNSNEFQHPGYFTLAPTLGSFVFIVFNDKNSSLRKLYENQTLQTIGLASYSIYLIHFPLFAIERYCGFRSVLNLEQFIVEFFLFALSIYFGYLIWKYVENFTRDKEKLSDSRLLTFTLVTTLIVILITSSNLISNRVAESYEMINLEKNTQELVDVCLIENNVILKLETCLKNYSENKKNILVVGDSVAHNVYWGMRENLTEEYSLSLLSVTGCIPFLSEFEKKVPNYDETKCVKNYEIVKNVLSEKKFHKILVQYDYSKFTYFENDLKLFENPLNLFTKEIQIYTENLILIGQPIKWERTIASNIYLERKFGLPKLIPIEDAFYWESIMKKHAANLNIQYISHFEYFCDKQGCENYQFADEKLNIYYYDTIHLTKYASEKFAEIIFSYIR